MREAERPCSNLRLTKASSASSGEQDWHDPGTGWQGRDGRSRLEGWSRNRRIVILRQRIERSLALTNATPMASCGSALLRSSTVGAWKYAIVKTAKQKESFRSRASDKKLISDGISFLTQRGA
jgi:hypothetical protein